MRVDTGRRDASFSSEAHVSSPAVDASACLRMQCSAGAVRESHSSRDVADNPPRESAVRLRDLSGQRSHLDLDIPCVEVLAADGADDTGVCVAAAAVGAASLARLARACRERRLRSGSLCRLLPEHAFHKALGLADQALPPGHVAVSHERWFASVSRFFDRSPRRAPQVHRATASER
jgi:hypothetical protein